MSATAPRAWNCLKINFTTVAGAMAAAVLAATAAAADPAVHPGHMLADRFAADTERARAENAARKEAARKEVERKRAAAAEKAAKEKARKDWEAEFLARAKAEAEERRKLELEATRLDALRAEREAREAEQQRQRAEKARLIEAQRRAEEARLAEQARKAEETERAAEALRLAAERAAEEARRIEQAKAEELRRAEAERQAAEARRAEEARIAEAARKAAQQRAEEIRKANEALRIAAERAAAERARRVEETQRAVAKATEEEARRVGALEADAEIARVAERLRKIREEHLARHMGTLPTERSVEPSSAPGTINRLGGPVIAPSIDAPKAATPQLAADIPSRDEAETAPRHEGRVTVLLQMEPRMRRFRGHESMDPVLCVEDGCYVSNGPAAPATFQPGRRAMRFGNVVGRRAGACNQETMCVFRGVDLGTLPAEVQPVDIRVMRHDRRAPEIVDVLSTCRNMNGRLACKDAIHGDGYTMWVIPESVATRVPIELFATGTAHDFANEPRAAMVPPRGRW